MRQIYRPREFAPLVTQHILQHPRCAIWADMGLGKTVMVLTDLDLLHTFGSITGPVLVIAPIRVARTTWPEEIEKWQHLTNLVAIPIMGNIDARKEILRRFLPRPGRVETRLQVFTINYDKLEWLVEYFKDKWPFRVVVSDESTKLKGYRRTQGTKRAQALAKVAWTRVDRFIELTGTPSPNGLQDLWGQIWFLDRGERLGRTFGAFETRWFQKGFDGFSIKPLPHAQDEIQGRVRDLCLRLDAADYFDLEKPIVTPVYVDLPPKAREQYREMEKKMYTELQNDLGGTEKVEAFSAAARTIKCLQMANGAAYINESNEEWIVTHDEKIDALRDIIDESAGKPVLVAYHFRSDLARLTAAFPKSRILDKDPRTIAEWNEGRIPILFAHPASAGHGLNLQYGGHVLVFFGHWWNLEEYQQIIERIGPVRQLQAGFKRPVFIYPIVARNTVDELVMERRESKKNIQELLLEAVKRKEHTSAQ